MPEDLADLLGHEDTGMVFKHYRRPVTPVHSLRRWFGQAIASGPVHGYVRADNESQTRNEMPARSCRQGGYF